MSLSDQQLETCESSRWDFSDLTALFLNCTLKRSPAMSHTDGLIEISQAIMEKNGVSVEVLRPVDHRIAYGVYPDMREQGWEEDDWPDIYVKVKAAHILVITSPIWLGEKSSVCNVAIERLYSSSGDLNEHGQYAYYGRVGGCLITGNEDGAKHCSMNILYSLQHLGYAIPSQADAGWPGRGRTRALLPRSGIGRTRERFHQPQHDIHDLESAPPGAHDQGFGRNPGPR